MTVRFEPKVLEWIKKQGGATWVRHATRALMGLSLDPDFHRWWDRLRLPVDEDARDVDVH